MEDQKIIELYWAREEEAIRATSDKYGRLCRSIVGSILVTAQRRSPEAVRSLEELEGCVSGRESVETELENRRIEQVIEDFLWRQEEEKRTVFLLRYWYFMSIENICRRTGFGESKVKSMLSRTRQKLRQHLEQEGIEL